MNTTVKNSMFLVIATVAFGIGRPSVARADGLITAKIPFDFIVGDTRLPAGEYTIQETSTGPTVLLIESTDGTRASYVSTISATSTDGNSTEPDVEFEMFGREHFLARIDLRDGMAREIVLSPSIVEEELVKTGERSGD
jgi:hypothetical protein